MQFFINVKQHLLRMRKENADARKVFDALHSFTNVLDHTTVDRLVRETRLTNGAVIRVLREVGDVEVGRFLVGRHRMPSRMDWQGLEYKKVIPGPRPGERKAAGAAGGDVLAKATGAGFEAVHKWTVRMTRGRKAVLLLPVVVSRADLMRVQAFCDQVAESLR